MHFFPTRLKLELIQNIQLVFNEIYKFRLPSIFYDSVLIDGKIKKSGMTHFFLLPCIAAEENPTFIFKFYYQFFVVLWGYMLLYLLPIDFEFDFRIFPEFG